MAESSNHSTQPSPLSIEERLTHLEWVVQTMQENVAAAQNPLQIVQPLYELDVIAALVPIELDRLKDHLKRFKDYTRVYRKDRSRRLRRMMTLDDIRKIRTRTLRGPDLGKFI